MFKLDLEKTEEPEIKLPASIGSSKSKRIPEKHLLSFIEGERWQPAPVLLLGKSHGWRCLVGYSPWGHKESDMTYQLNNNSKIIRRKFD